SLIDVILTNHRDLAAAKAFFRSAKPVTGVMPDWVTTDGHDAYTRAIQIKLGKHVQRRTNSYLNTASNRIAVVMKADVDQAPASKARYPQCDSVNGTTNYAITSAVGCVSTLRPPRGAFIICTEPPSCSASWRPKRGSPQPEL